MNKSYDFFQLEMVIGNEFQSIFELSWNQIHNIILFIVYTRGHREMRASAQGFFFGALADSKPFFCFAITITKLT